MTEKPASCKPVVAVGGIVIRDGAVLLIRRGKEPMKGHWSIPGGTVEAGELLVEALCREMQEETGLAVRVVELLEVVERVFRNATGDVEYHYVIHDYACDAPTGEPRAGGDAAEVIWARANELEKFALTEAALRVIRKAFALRAAKLQEPS